MKKPTDATLNTERTKAMHRMEQLIDEAAKLGQQHQIPMLTYLFNIQEEETPRGHLVQAGIQRIKSGLQKSKTNPIEAMMGEPMLSTAEIGAIVAAGELSMIAEVTDLWNESPADMDRDKSVRLACLGAILDGAKKMAHLRHDMIKSDCDPEDLHRFTQQIQDVQREITERIAMLESGTMPQNIEDTVAEALYRAANPDAKPH